VVIGVASSDGEAAVRAMLRRFGLDGVVAFVAGYDSGPGTASAARRVNRSSRARVSASGAKAAPAAIQARAISSVPLAGAGLVIGVASSDGEAAVRAMLRRFGLDGVVARPPARRRRPGG
jgi:phosphoglycolate phosphatase